MPIYEYECTECGTRTERLILHGDSSVKACDVCGGELRKLLSAPAFQFKGSGWYVTDYAGRKSGGTDAGSDSAESASKESKAEPSAAGKDSGKEASKSTSKESKEAS